MAEQTVREIALGTLRSDARVCGMFEFGQIDVEFPKKSVLAPIEASGGNRQKS